MRAVTSGHAGPLHILFIHPLHFSVQIGLMNTDVVKIGRTEPSGVSNSWRSWWQRFVQPSVVRRLVLAQIVLLVQLWGSAALWLRLVPGSALPEIWHVGLVAIPIVISAMLLMIPVWLSVRVAVRPWRRINDEISARGAGDLSALTYEPKEQELRPLVRTVNDLLERVRDGVTRERRFIADAAHELRTPLAAMRVNAEALHERGVDPCTQELLDGMVQSGDRAARLVGQLLNLMRADAPQSALPPRPLRLDELAQECLAALAPLARQRGLALQLDAPEPVEVLGEAETLASMIDNLVENAMKYSPDQGEIVVRVSRNDAGALLTVADQGAGIPAELHSRVFERFYRIAGQSRPGSGLGLSIVEAAIARHQGVVSLSNVSDGPGLLVSVVLPHAGAILRKETVPSMRRQQQ